VALDGPFIPGAVTTGKIRKPGYEGLPFWALTVALDPPHRFAFA
jgi:hypothetical protein